MMEIILYSNYKMSRFITHMSKSITIDNLSTIEKIELMEKLWEDLSSTLGYAPPNWHGEVLARRKKAVEKGEATYTDWEKAKEEIRKKSHDYSDS
jgi:hypothetical protein